MSKITLYPSDNIDNDLYYATRFFDEIELSAGTFNIHRPIVLAQKRIHFYGQGAGVTIIECIRPSNEEFTAIISEAITIGSICLSIAEYTIHDFTINCNCQNITTLTTIDKSNAARGLAITKTINSHIYNITVNDTGLTGISFSGDNSIIEYCTVNNSGYIPYSVSNDLNAGNKADGNGITIGASSGSSISNCTAYSSRDLCFTLWNSSNCIIDSCVGSNSLLDVATTNTRGGASIETISADNSTISNCTFNAVAGSIIQVTSPNATVSNIICNNCTGQAFATSGDVHGGRFDNIQSLRDNPAGDGILLGQPGDTQDNYDIELTNCILEKVNGASNIGIISYYIRDSLIQNNNIELVGVAASDGIRYTGSGDTVDKNLIIDGNTINGAPSDGIRIVSAKSIDITNNLINNVLNTIYIASIVDGASITIENNTLTNFTSINPYGISNNSGELPLLTHVDLTINTPNLATYNFAEGSTVTHLNSSTQLPETYVSTATPGTWNLQ